MATFVQCLELITYTVPAPASLIDDVVAIDEVFGARDRLARCVHVSEQYQICISCNPRVRTRADHGVVKYSLCECDWASLPGADSTSSAPERDE